MRPALVVDPVSPDAGAIAEAAAVLRRGELVAFPTETVYGLGARAWDPRAIARVFAVKRRPVHHPLIAHVVDEAQARDLAASWPERASLLAAAFWPGPLTLVVERAARVPGAISGGGSSLAVRAPAHPVALALIRELGEPIAAPSANVYQGLSPTTAAHVLRQLGDSVGLVLDGGPCQAGIESTVVDVRGGLARVLRPGALDLARLRSVVPDVEAPGAGARTAPDQEPRASPGMDARHYAPRARLVLAGSRDEADAAARELGSRGARVALVVRGAPRRGSAGAPPAPLELRSLPDDPVEYARRLYATLHELDDAGVDAIVVEDVPRAGRPGEAWLAVADRLSRAASEASEAERPVPARAPRP
jgi:L-threonylcarbamoyladenylate synthase